MSIKKATIFIEFSFLRASHAPLVTCWPPPTWRWREETSPPTRLRSLARAPARSRSSNPRPPWLLILVQSFKMSFANRLADGCNVFQFFADGVDAETEFVGTPD